MKKGCREGREGKRGKRWGGRKGQRKEKEMKREKWRKNRREEGGKGNEEEGELIKSGFLTFQLLHLVDLALQVCRQSIPLLCHLT